jgi:hypothetical protein
MSVTDRLLAGAPIPPLPGPDGVAERLVLLVHRGVEWDVWGGARRARYWDALTDRVRAATYAGPSIADWWESVSADITSSPRSSEERAELAGLLAADDQRAVLTSLRRHAATLVLRTRVVVEHHRAGREEQNP